MILKKKRNLHRQREKGGELTRKGNLKVSWHKKSSFAHFFIIFYYYLLSFKRVVRSSVSLLVPEPIEVFLLPSVAIHWPDDCFCYIQIEISSGLVTYWRSRMSDCACTFGNITHVMPIFFYFPIFLLI